MNVPVAIRIPVHDGIRRASIPVSGDPAGPASQDDRAAGSERR